MNKRLFVGALVMSFSLVMILRATLHQETAHRFEDQCHACHLGLSQPDMLIGDINVLCGRCHENRTTRSHPSGFRTGRQLPERFPTTDGRMVCVTCHFPHPAMGGKDSGPVLAGMNPYMLRFEEPGKPFCVQCHTAETIEQGSSHAVSLGLAHRINPDPDAVKLLDRSSIECLACHDGTVSSNVEMGGASWSHARGIGLSHPVGISYEDVYREPGSRLHPERSLPDELTLVQGRVECVTCHDHYSGLPGLLVLDNTGSRLCLACHNL